jgi:hypothetical protein
MKRAFESVTRRGALAACAAAGALAAFAQGLFNGRVPMQRRQAIPIAASEQAGYRVTEHVRRYYRSTLL